MSSLLVHGGIAGVKLPLTVVGLFAASDRSFLHAPCSFRAEHQTALQVLNQNREQAVAGVAVEIDHAGEVRVAVAGLQQGELDLVGVIRRNRTGNFAVTAGLFGDTVAVRLNADEAVVCIAGDNVRTAGDDNFLRVLGLDLAGHLLSLPYRFS